MGRNPTRRDQGGFTLIEMMLTLAVGSIVTLAGLSILAMAVRYFAVTTRSLQADAELMTALQVVKEHLTQAVDLRGYPNDANCINSLNSNATEYISGNSPRNDGHGAIRNCNSRIIPRGESRYLAIFTAELGQVTNRIKGVSLAFVAPGLLQNGFSRSGALYITRMGRNPQQDPVSEHWYDEGGSQPLDLRPNAGSIVFTDLVAADVDEVRVRSEGLSDQGRVITAGTGMAVSAKITLTRRIFLDSELTTRWYCAPGSMVCDFPSAAPNINEAARFVDRSRSISVTFRNNLQLERNVGGESAVMRKRTFGNIYFFRPITPTF